MKRPLTSSREGAPAEEPEALRARIGEFVSACRQPAVLEPGEKTIVLEAGRFDLEIHGAAVLLHAWSEQTSLVRRITGVRREQRGKLELTTRRLSSAEGTLAILDLARGGEQVERQAGRLEFRERFRRLLSRRFGDWTVAQISAAPDLEHSLSPSYARALLTRGEEAFAAIGAPDEGDAGAAAHILSFGLIWLDYLRKRESRRAIGGLRLFVPQGRTATTANRLPFLSPSAGCFELYEFGADGSTRQVEEKDYGNLSTSLSPAAPPFEPAAAVAQWIARLQKEFPAECVPRPDGTLSLRVRGLEFARVTSAAMTFGLGEERLVTPANFSQVEALAGRISGARASSSSERQNWLYSAAPEKWLESEVRAGISIIDSTLLAGPVYEQLPAVAGADRGIIDLVAADFQGQLAVLELKASEDIHLPLQGLDYWMRVKWHLDRREFQKRGYFPGLALDPRPPRLLLVSPAFDFHPTTETILRFFSPQVEVERVGVGGGWRDSLKVIFRARGAEKP